MSRPNGRFQLQGESPKFPHSNLRLDADPHHGQETAQTRVQNACLEPTLDQDNEIVNTNLESSSHNKRRKLNSKTSKGRKLTSKVWDDFTKYKDKEGNDRARCNLCKNDFDGSSVNGTTHLKNHLASCQNRKNNDGEGDKLAEHEKGNLTDPVVLQDKFVINQELNQLGVVRAIIKYGISKINFIKPDILHVYHYEKEKLRRYLTKLSCRFNLTANFVGDGLLMVLHFINDHWELKQKVISFHYETDNSLAQNLKKSLLDLYVDKNICSVVTDVNREEFKEGISSWLTKRGSLPFCGHLLSASWIKSFLKNSVIEEVLCISNKIRQCFVYVNNPSNEPNFSTAVENAKSKGMKLTSGSIPRFSCHLHGTLGAAVLFKPAFYELEQTDSDFKPINLTKEEWDDAEAVCVFLKELNDAASSFKATKCHTANVFFPKICGIYLKLLVSEKSDNHHVRKIASRSVAWFFSNYWSNYKLVLAIAVFLDPRFKMDIIEHWYKKIYSDGAEGHLIEICDGVTNVYREYLNASSGMLDEFGMPITLSETPDLDLYLQDTKLPSVKEFDILNWWHLNTPRYPILARMARDFLALPISPPAFTNSSWYPEIEKTMRYNGLDDDLRLALICTKIWLESSENN